MRINTAMTGAVIPGLLAGVIYFIIAFATGASAVASIIGGIVVAVVAVAIGLIFRAVFRRRAASRPDRHQAPQHRELRTLLKTVGIRPTIRRRTAQKYSNDPSQSPARAAKNSRS